jgi:conjugative relaxase-like TrwC/TraI family protein
MKLRDPEYLLSQVALGIEDYYMGSGEAPGVWHGRWADQLGLSGVVDADQLRALVEGLHPATGADLLAGRPERAVNAFDSTLSAPKSASLLWAFGDAEVSSAVSIAHVEAAAMALDFLESKAALANTSSSPWRWSAMASRSASRVKTSSR